MVGLGLSFKKAGLDLDRKIWQSAHLYVLHYFLPSNSHIMYDCIQQLKGSMQLIPKK